MRARRVHVHVPMGRKQSKPKCLKRVTDENERKNASERKHAIERTMVAEINVTCKGGKGPHIRRVRVY